MVRTLLRYALSPLYWVLVSGLRELQPVVRLRETTVLAVQRNVNVMVIVTGFITFTLTFTWHVI